MTLEVTTRRARNLAEREADLAESLAFARLHLASAAGTAARTPAFSVGADGTVEEVGRP